MATSVRICMPYGHLHQEFRLIQEDNLFSRKQRCHGRRGVAFTGNTSIKPVKHVVHF